MFQKILIANRGEIAVRIMRTARRMGIRTVAVFSEADAKALHVREADEAHGIGPSPAAQSYLRGDVILEVARRSGAEAIHPGYGFLSENADFADACAAAGIVFIGPPASAIRAMGSKAESKRLMVAAGVPTVPGYHGEAQDEATLAAEAQRIGFPVLIKASAGGGGKGMRPVHAPADFAAELAGARREALAAFGDGRVLIEKYLQRPRHVEVQVFGDRHGRVTHIHTRDCSVQRRHQKVLEEAPAPDLPDALRASLHEAAENAARAVGYTNAGTVEFVVEGGDAFFLEMNTRLQVEHPVTEMVTGLDLVEWQLRVARGEALPASWPPPAQGHAVEVRLYAEDPAQDFRPATGRLQQLQPCLMGEGLRFDTGFTGGDDVTGFYDPMLAKLIAWGADRPAAFRRLAAALGQLDVQGIGNNAVFLGRLARHPALLAGELDTGFIARHAAELLAPTEAAPEAMLLAAMAGAMAAGQAPSPWAARHGWRLQGAAETVQLWSDGVAPRRVVIAGGAGVLEMRVEGGPARRARWTRQGGLALFTLDDGPAEPVMLSGEGLAFTLSARGALWHFRALDPYAPPGEDAAAESRLSAPIPGRVVRLLVAVGEAVAKGQLLAVLEAMKTEIKILAPRDGVIGHLGCAEGESVEEGTEIVSFVME
ncbi:biotin carboxylase N-terminal domain-containing protein [Sediminicoccus sp. KRV36]|uniref:acetyl/propionyl/methylcrotonyl-CoA carboxylase subunit alpha n=1 Tax=Sediminicoccus sp. KRV36 TaxID=3133721 RepID=UPI0024B1D624|nr:biotin carboxylase N-terminal domain-containing protein [Sediminicoccus rosea]